MCGPKPHPSLVHMHMCKGVELLYKNIRTLHYSLKWDPRIVQEKKQNISALE